MARVSCRKRQTKLISFHDSSDEDSKPSATVSQLVEAVEVEGFDAQEKLEEAKLSVDGMMCMKNCGTTVKNALFCNDGVVSVSISLEEKSAVYAEGIWTLKSL